MVPVLTLSEAATLDPSHLPSPVPHPRVYSTTKSTTPNVSRVGPLLPGQHTHELLEELGLSTSEQKRLALDGALGTKAQVEAMNAPKL